MNRMGDMLSQAEIDALLKGTSSPAGGSSSETGEGLSSQEIDALGEVGNVSMGTAATTLFTLLGQKVVITTPRVSVTSWEQMSKEYDSSFVGVDVEYTNGLIGNNLLILKEDDVKIITDLMMGGEGKKIDGELTDLHLSAISEPMNQMIGSAATSMSSMFGKRIDISPPKAFVMDFKSGQTYFGSDGDSQKIVKVAFKMVVGDLIDSEIMQLIPISFAKALVDNLLNVDVESPAGKPGQTEVPSMQHNTDSWQTAAGESRSVYQERKDHGQQQGYDYGMDYEEPLRTHHDQHRPMGTVNVQPAHFQPLEDSGPVFDKNNISLIMDVPLQVTVELGRTHKLIKDILEFGPGSIVELDKLAGDPVDILVNGKIRLYVKCWG